MPKCMYVCMYVCMWRGGTVDRVVDEKHKTSTDPLPVVPGSNPPSGTFGQCSVTMSRVNPSHDMQIG